MWPPLIQPSSCVCGAVPEFAQGEWPKEPEKHENDGKKPNKIKKKRGVVPPAALSTPDLHTPPVHPPPEGGLSGGGSGHGSDGSITNGGPTVKSQLSTCSRFLTTGMDQMKEFEKNLEAGLVVTQDDKERALVKFGRHIKEAEEMWRKVPGASRNAGEAPLRKAGLFLLKIRRQAALSSHPPAGTACVVRYSNHSSPKLPCML